MQRLINVFNLGKLEYNQCLNIQKYFLGKHLTELSQETNFVKDTILFVEHHPTYTIGIRRKQYSDDEISTLRSLNAQVEFTDRGGLITFHGPGQLVMYPIINLKHFNPSLKWYVSQLESIVIDLCKKNYNLNAHRLCDAGYTGVWAKDKKIAAIGVHCKRYITYHGIALNCNTNMSWFKNIVPCGIQDKEPGSLSELLERNITTDEVLPLMMKSFETVFNAKLELKSTEETDSVIKNNLLGNTF